ncbi:hypothetical protein I4U23_005126 [Adineta vaga]|nr:hypothetical protein I4U23_005126 [Adineta vaga]
MITIWQYIFCVCFLSTVIDGKFHLYYTEVSSKRDYSNCLYSFALNSDNSEWQFIPYCIRDKEHDSNDQNKQCDKDDASYTFEQLKFKNIDSLHLYDWNTPIDVISNYQKYLTNHDLTLANWVFCNCSGNWFGTQCQYSFHETNKNDELNKIITNQFGSKGLLDIFGDVGDLLKDSSFLTCYEGLRCQSTICLDWREICNGVFNCENGEDEPMECRLLEINECQNDEYRCRFGMCIPKTFLRDFSYDCMDFSDEKPVIHRNMDFENVCSMSSKLECDYRLCEIDEFSCSDGQCLLPKDWFAKCLESSNCHLHCHNGRDLFFSQNLLSLNSSRNDFNLRNTSYECWFLLVCVSVPRNSELFNYNYKNCLCSERTVGESHCLEYFQKHCPTSFVFQTASNFLYPFIQFFYHNTLNISSEWWLPTHFCYNSTRCPVLPVKGLPLIRNLLCVARNTFQHSTVTARALIQLFSACTFAHSAKITSDSRLFYCAKSMKLISKHKVYDQLNDCLYREDENSPVDAMTMYIANLTDRFKCATTDQWVSRRAIGKGSCTDKSDTFYFGECRRASDIACQFLRGLYKLPLYYLFQENCDGHQKKIIFQNNETDETDCEEWPRYRRCDGYWDLNNGEDELNCSMTIPGYITYTILKCRAYEHYCMFYNRTMGCLSKEYADNGEIDCIGATDERKMCAATHPERPFRCSSGDCSRSKVVCNQEMECPDGDDESICSWTNNITDNHMWYMFFCKNGTAIRYTKRCDNVIDCQSEAEDEWFCDLDYKRTINTSEFIEEYPPFLTDSSSIPTVETLQSSVSLRTDDNSFEIPDAIDDWYCNRGLIVRKKSSSIICFCPPSYYGSRCQYQSERLLITIRVDTQITLSGHDNPRNAIRLLACLIFNDSTVHHEEILHVRSMKQMFYLNYPLPPPKQQGNWIVRLDAFLVNTFSVYFMAAWKFDVLFSFLPFNRLVLHLTLGDPQICNTLPCIHGTCRKYLNSPHDEYCQCEQQWSGQYCDIFTECSCAGSGKCLDRYRPPICVCPLGRMGMNCHALFNPCHDIQCQHDGTCIPLDERLPTKFTCACREGYYGAGCELLNAYVDIQLSKTLLYHDQLSSIALIVHFLEFDKDVSGMLFVQNRLLFKQVQYDKILRVLNNGYEYLSRFILLQIFHESNHFEYYIAAVNQRPRTHLTTNINQLNRCPYVNELLLNRAFHNFSTVKKVKYYQRSCQVNPMFKCFYDEAYLCFCDKDRLPQCYFFQRQSTQCTVDYCQNQGHCVQNNFNGAWYFACVCSGCSYGSLCQLTTSQYTLSLDALLGRDILTNVSLSEQSMVIKIVLTILILMLTLGFISNALSTITFIQSKVQEVGCGLYLFCLPIVGQLGLIALASRFFYLLRTQLYHVDDYTTTFWSCVSLEYLLSVSPMLFDWLTACVATERSIYIIKGASFSKSDSVWWAKRVILLLTIAILCTGWHEPFTRELIDDPRATTRHAWCTIKFRWSWLKYYKSVIILINLIMPSLINVIATMFLLHKSTRMKQAFGKSQKDKTYFATFKKQLPLYGSPLSLVVFSLLRLIFAFTLVCIIYNWQKYVYLTAYLISFAPLIGTFPIFVLPAEIYMTEFKKFFERMHRKLKRRGV